jgi:hypothetical protein
MMSLIPINIFEMKEFMNTRGTSVFIVTLQ